MKTIAAILRTLCVSAAMIGADSAWGQNVLPQPPMTGTASTGIGVSTVNGQSVVMLNGKEIYSGPATGAVSSRSCNVNGVEYSAVFDGDKVLWESAPGAAKQMQSQPGGLGGGGMDVSQFNEPHRQMVERMMEAQRQFMQGQGGMAFGTNFSLSGGGARGLSGGGSWGSSGGSARGSSGGGAQAASGGFSSGSASGQSSGSGGVNSSGRRGGFGSPILPGQPLPVTVPQPSESTISIKTVNGSTVIVYQGREFSVGPTKGSLSAKSKSIQGEDFAAAFEDDRVIWENVPGAAQKVK